MQAALLSIFCSLGSRNLERIKTLTKQVGRGFLDGVLLLQPPGCLPAPWGCTSTSWLEPRAGDGRRHTSVGLVQERSSAQASVPFWCMLLGSGGAGISVMSFLAVSLPAVGSGEE